MDAIKQADAIWAVLVEHAGANEKGGETFRHFMDGEHNHEYRFIGALGFGGKFWKDRTWRVTCYREDETPQRLEAIARTNYALQCLQRTTP